MVWFCDPHCHLLGISPIASCSTESQRPKSNMRPLISTGLISMSWKHSDDDDNKIQRMLQFSEVLTVLKACFVRNKNNSWSNNKREENTIHRRVVLLFLRGRSGWNGHGGKEKKTWKHMIHNDRLWNVGLWTLCKFSLFSKMFAVNSLQGVSWAL